MDEDEVIAFVLYPDGTLDLLIDKEQQVFGAEDYLHAELSTLEHWQEHLIQAHGVDADNAHSHDLGNAIDLHGGLHFMAGDRP